MTLWKLALRRWWADQHLLQILLPNINIDGNSLDEIGLVGFGGLLGRKGQTVLAFCMVLLLLAILHDLRLMALQDIWFINSISNIYATSIINCSYSFLLQFYWRLFVMPALIKYQEAHFEDTLKRNNYTLGIWADNNVCFINLDSLPVSIAALSHGS